jgi:hypothetical protein
MESLGSWDYSSTSQFWTKVLSWCRTTGSTPSIAKWSLDFLFSLSQKLARLINLTIRDQPNLLTKDCPTQELNQLIREAPLETQAWAEWYLMMLFRESVVWSFIRTQSSLTMTKYPSILKSFMTEYYRVGFWLSRKIKHLQLKGIWGHRKLNQMLREEKVQRRMQICHHLQC